MPRVQTKAASSVDPVIAAAILAKLDAAAVEMSFTLKRTSRSLYVKDAEDFSVSIVSASGQCLGTPDRSGVRGFMGDVLPLLEAVPDLGPEEVIITNDAHSSGGISTHIPDVHLLTPYYADDILVGYGMTMIHSSDMGGRVPSSVSPLNTSVFQEGLQIPPIKLVKNGIFDVELEKIIRINTRTPDANIADIKAMLAALKVGREAVIELVERYGVEAYLATVSEREHQSALMALKVASKLPPGVYTFCDFLDDDGLTRYPVRYKVRISIDDGGHIEVDFRGTDIQVDAAFNIVTWGRPHSMTIGRVRSTLVTLDPTSDIYAGFGEALSVRSNRGTVVDAVRPAAMGVRHGTAVRLADVLGGAFFQAAPDIMPCAGSGVVIPVVVSEQHGYGRYSQVITRLFGGFGGANGQDGYDGRDNSYSNLASSPMESSESELNVHVLKYELRPDSGGPGQWRGGVGRELTFKVLGDGTQVLGRGLERFVFAPWGALGGKPGATTQVVVNEGTPTERRYHKIDVLYLRRGDVITFRTPGGGGYGDPLLRDPLAVLGDVRSELVSVKAASEEYGVVIDTSSGPIVFAEVDAAATENLRGEKQAMRDGNAEPMFNFGPARTAWEAVFSAEWYDAFIAKLLQLPADRRTYARAEIFDAVFRLLPPAFPEPEPDGEELSAELIRIAADAAWAHLSTLNE